jgi:hypothetical protein
VQFVRSGGAGGQNVNKGARGLCACADEAQQLMERLLPPAVNTKADIRFDVVGADFLPDWVKDNLMTQARRDAARRTHAVLRSVPQRTHGSAPQEKNRMNNEGELVVNSSRHRTQKCAATAAHAAAALVLTATLSCCAGRTTRMRWTSCR